MIKYSFEDESFDFQYGGIDGLLDLGVINSALPDEDIDSKRFEAKTVEKFLKQTVSDCTPAEDDYDSIKLP